MTLKKKNYGSQHEIQRKTIWWILVYFLDEGFTIASLCNITETWLRISQMPYRCEIDKNSCG